MLRGRIGIAVLFFALFHTASVRATSVVVEKYPTWETRGRITRTALEYLGTPYVYAGVSREGVDCSGLVYRVYRDVTGESLPRRVVDLLDAGEAVPAEPQPGDLVFFDTTGGPSHVGIYLGESRVVHAASAGPRTGVTIDSLTTSYYKNRYIGSRRYVEETLPVIRIEADGQPAWGTISGSFPMGVPMRFTISDTQGAGRWFTFSVYRDEEFVLSKRIKSSPQEDPSLVWFLPSEGRFRISLMEGSAKSLLVLEFDVGGRP